ncbi:MAG TPA: hypothetical protein VLA15_04325 [Desulfurivibrionaceae bacterium]|nr:hypothetical protein [Desulfurivibrionaceae bacterium]
MLWVILPAALLLAGSGPALAATANGCHCFQERAYDPKVPFAADDYILTTTFNSLISRSFNLSKQRIVMLKMQGGVAGDDLLIGLRLAQTTQTDSQTLFDRRKAGTAWPALLAGINPAPELAGSAWFKKLKTGGPAAEAGEAVADRMLVEFFKVQPGRMEELRSAGLDARALSLALILAHYTGREPEFFIRQHQGEKKSWSEIAHLAGVTPKEAGILVLNYPEKKLTE